MAEFVKCRYDVRPLLDDGVAEDEPVERETCLVIVASPGGGLRVFEIAAAFYAYANELSDWETFAEDEEDVAGLHPPASVLRAFAEIGVLDVRE
jgi:hypothetical protein